jgi:hypothetical protein
VTNLTAGYWCEKIQRWESINMDVDESKRRRRGRRKLDPDEVRSHAVTSRLNKAEFDLLESKCIELNMQLGEFMRTAALHKLAPVIASTNIDMWVELSRSASNLNQIAYQLNSVEPELIPDISEIRKALSEFRDALIGAAE